jgi:hypothetical protein
MESLTASLVFIHMASGTRGGWTNLTPTLRALASERWTLVATYEHEGNRYVVATRNDACLPRTDAALSPRESQVLGCALVRVRISLKVTTSIARL